ncbi:MAG: insulinase family protein [Cellulosilyticaceae bacterium]
MKTSIKRYTQLQEAYISEIDCTVHQYEHNETKAKVLYFETEDTHKTFGITFRTPPPDSTGVPHIIEHSVLCGSEKYPLKDPFIELSKGSLNTYLNAMTYPDKTMYPISSENDADFHNLMDVYLDAVFFPNIYKNPYILMQEGWRYHIESPEAPLEYKGVVYNEMKGAFSSPEEVGFRKIKESLFPDTIYSNESGGAPEAIPNLTEEDFLDFHKKYYHPSNAYIGLYGKMDLEEVLGFIDKNYLSKFEYQDIDSTIGYQKPFEAIREVSYPYSVAEEKPNQLYVSYNCVVDETVNRQLMVEMGILEYILLETPASPLKKALIQKGIGDDAFGAFQTHMKQPIFTIMAKNVSEEKKDAFYEVIDAELRRLVKEGIPEALLKGAIQVKEFELREGDFKGYSKGLLYYIGCMKSWMYDKDPLIYLRTEEILKNIHEKQGTGYFESLIEKYLLNNTHGIKMLLYPKVGLDQEIQQQVTEKLEKIKASWDEKTLNEAVEKTLKFNAYQEVIDTEEQRACIPLLEKEDLERDIKFPRFKVETLNNCEYIITPTFTNQIAYMTWMIDLSGIENGYMPYLGMMVGMLSKLNTKNYSYEELSMAIDEHLGGIEFHIQAMHTLEDPENFKKVFVIKSKALLHELDAQVSIMKEIIADTKMDNYERVYEIIKEMRSMMEMAISSEGHKIAYSRLLSSFSPVEAFEEETKGLTFYHMVCDLADNWETNKEQTMQKLQNAYSYLSNGLRYKVGLTVDEKEVATCMQVIQKTLDTLPKTAIQPLQQKFMKHTIQEALVYPGNVNYVAMGYNFKDKGYSYHGGMQMLKSILATDYLWNEVRVKNGAYGCFADFRKSGNMFFVSYRDPNVEKTMEVYRAVSDYVANLNLSERELLQYLIGTISGMDFPYTPSTEGAAACIYYLLGTTKEELQKIRDEIFETDNERLRSYAPIIQSVIEENQYCVFGNTTSIEENKDLFADITKV